MIRGTTDVAIKEKSKRRSDEMQRIENIEKCQRTSKSTLNENYRKERMKSMLKNKAEQGITLVALVITILFSYDEKLKCSNSKGFLLQTI